MSPRRAAAFGALALVLLLALIPIGRWERAHHARDEIRGMRRVLAAVGPIGNSTLDAYRVGLVPFDCLIYKRGSNPYALELCIDPRGRLVETIDRRSGAPKFWSLREDPTRSTIRVDRNHVNRLLRKLGVPAHVDEGPRGQSPAS
jgi:hypothetical protein